MKLTNKTFEIIVFICSVPLLVLSLLQHTFEEIQKRSGKFRDRLFMRRFRLIDSKHVEDFIKWNRDYRRSRDAANG